MSYLALYRKYRPVNFDEVVGQDVIVKILKNAIMDNKMSHAYLFSGPRGTGKTSVAKLIAKIINCENRKDINPCDKCSSCIAFNDKNNPDIIEMDAASNNGIEEIREIRDKVSLLPTLSMYKIYIIDEVHMLSKSAFNALLKTLEEPPEHVIFILATTEFYMVPETIISRCQCFEFERVSELAIVDKLNTIVSHETIEIDKEVLNLIARYSFGGLRDAISMLDKLSSFTKNVAVKDFYELRGMVDSQDFDYIVTNIFEKNISNVLNKVDDLSKKGKNVILLGENLLVYIKDLIVECNINNNSQDINTLYKMIDIINEMIINMKKSNYPKVVLEIGLLKTINVVDESIESEKLEEKNENISVENKKNPSKVVVIEEKEIETPVIKEEKSINISNNEELIEKNRIIRINNAFALADKKLFEDLKISWVKLTDYLYNKEFSGVVSYLLDGTLRVAGEKDIIVSVRYDSIIDNAMKNMDKLELLFNLISGKTYRIAFVLDEEWENLKKEYVSRKTNGNNYEYQEEIEIIPDDDSVELEEVTKEAIDLFGADLVEIK